MPFIATFPRAIRTPMLTLTLVQELDNAGEDAAVDTWTCDTLRDALLDLWKTRTAHVGGVESTCAEYAHHSRTLALTVQNSPEYRTGVRECRRLFIRGISVKSATRLIRKLGIRPINRTL